MSEVQQPDQHPHATGIRRRSLFGAAARDRGRRRRRSGARERRPREPSGPPAGRDVLRGFRRPGSETAAGFRWWWPHGAVDPEEIAREVDQVAAAGFGDARDRRRDAQPAPHAGITIDLEKQGWGTASWVAGVKAALDRGCRHGIRVDITIGPSWPAAVPTVTPDDDAACSELAHGQAIVAGGTTYDAALPDPVVAPESESTAHHLVAVQAHRVTVGDAGRGRRRRSTPTSYVDLTGLRRRRPAHLDRTRGDGVVGA